MLLFVLVAVPVLVGAVAFFLGKRRITPFEVIIQVGVVGALIVGGYYLTRWGGVQDYELWNGRIASKPWGSTSCCHSYECNCREECTTNEKKERVCKQVCQTCYRHSSDYYHDAYTSNGERVYHSGCDQTTPSDWSAIRIGDPTVVEHRYTNYIKADPDEVIRAATKHFDAKLPAYPQIVSRWKARRFLFVGIVSAEGMQLDYALDEINADLGAVKQVNLIVVVVDEADPAYFDALVEDWLGGKKNDVVLVIGAPQFPAIGWARVMAWNEATGGEDEFKGAIAARVQALGTFDGKVILQILREEVERGYKRQSFTKFEYLMARAQPPGWAVALLFGLGLGLSSLLQWFFWRNRRRMTGTAPHEHVHRAVGRLRAWWDRRGGPAPTPAPEPAPVIASPLDSAIALMEAERARASAVAAANIVDDAPPPRRLVTIQTIESVTPIAGADRIAKARVGGRTVVIQKGSFAAGDRCVFFEIGSVLPAGRSWSKFLRKQGYRVTEREVFGVVSQGLVLSVSILDDEQAPPDGDFRHQLGVTEATD